jgi:hypothetical protein
MTVGIGVMAGEYRGSAAARLRRVACFRIGVTGRAGTGDLCIG